MVKPAYQKFLVLGISAMSFACNFEIGNPEPPPPSGRIDNLSLSLAGYSDCADRTSVCTAAPMKLATATDSMYSMEMSRIQLQLQSLELTPFPQQVVSASVDLLYGTQIQLGVPRNISDIAGVSLFFTADKGSTFEIQGQIRISNSFETYTVPITLNGLDVITAQSTLPNPESGQAGLVFDAEAWFDFSGDNPEISNALRNLTSGPCRTGDSAQCQSYRNLLAKQIGKKIGRSMSAAQGSGNGKGGQ